MGTYIKATGSFSQNHQPSEIVTTSKCHQVFESLKTTKKEDEQKKVIRDPPSKKPTTRRSSPDTISLGTDFNNQTIAQTPDLTNSTNLTHSILQWTP